MGKHNTLIVMLSLALIVVTIAVYWQVGNHEFLLFDDHAYITENPHVAGGLTRSNIIWAFTSVHAANWHPITWLSHMTDVQLYGINPRGHHLTNVIIHTISTVFLFLLLSRLTRSIWQSLFVATLFSLHPLHVESVAWVAERKDVLSALFCFITLLMYSVYVNKRKITPYLLAILFYVLGLMSKPMLVTLPLVMLLMDFWPLDRYRHEEYGQGFPQFSDRLMALIKEKIPFLACSLFSAIITVYAQHRGGAIDSLEVIPLGLRFENAITVYVKYIFKSFWPNNLAFFYPFPSSIAIWQVICSLLFLLLVSAATIRAMRQYPYLMVGWFWFLVTLLPVIGLIKVGAQSMADRYSYIPMTGLLIMTAWGASDLTKGLRYRKSILSLLSGALIIVSATLTWKQLGYWQNDDSLCRHALKVTTGNYFAHNNLGTVLIKNPGNLDAAINEFQEAVAINPNYTFLRINLARALAQRGDLDAALKECQKALTSNLDLYEAHLEIGNILSEKGDLDTAINEYHKALAINPDSSEAHYNLGIALSQKGDLDATIKEYQEAIRINPIDYMAHINLGITLSNKGNVDAAIQEFKEVLMINPNDAKAQTNLEIALAQKRKQDNDRK
jgi:protein O-mannosyl-transferase